MERITTYIIKKNNVEISRETNSRIKYDKAISGYKKLPASGSERLKQYATYLNSPDKLEGLILGSHSNMGQYLEKYYK